jgi:hypothetical protein
MANITNRLIKIFPRIIELTPSKTVSKIQVLSNTSRQASSLYAKAMPRMPSVIYRFAMRVIPDDVRTSLVAFQAK